MENLKIIGTAQADPIPVLGHLDILGVGRFDIINGVDSMVFLPEGTTQASLTLNLHGTTISVPFMFSYKAK